MSVRHLDGLGSRWARVRVAAALLAGAEPTRSRRRWVPRRWTQAVYRMVLPD